MALKELDANPELRDDPSLKDFNDIVTLAKSFKDTKTFVGNSIRPPGPDASAEVKQEFIAKLQKHAPELVLLKDGDSDAENMVWERLGRPKDAKGYEFKAPDDTPIDLESLRAIAASTGMTKKQFEAAAKLTVEKTQKAREAAAADNKALRSEWGQAYDDKLKQAAAAAAKLNQPPELVKLIQEGKLPSGQLKTWAELAKSLGAEGTEIGKQNGGGSGALTPAEAEAQLEEIMGNPAYFDGRHPQHDSLVKKALKLQEAISGVEKA